MDVRVTEAGAIHLVGVSMLMLVPRKPIQKTASHRIPQARVSLEIAGDLLELVDYFFFAPGHRTDGGLEAMVDMIVDQDALGAFEGANHGMHLLRNFGASAAAFDHRDNGAQMSLGAPQARGHVLVRAMNLRLVPRRREGGTGREATIELLPISHIDIPSRGIGISTPGG